MEIVFPSVPQGHKTSIGAYDYTLACASSLRSSREQRLLIVGPFHRMIAKYIQVVFICFSSSQQQSFLVLRWLLALANPSISCYQQCSLLFLLLAQDYRSCAI